jgi:hypothetical protein
MVSVAVAGKKVPPEGVKVTEMVQLLPAARVARHVKVWANCDAFGPPILILLMLSVAAPVFESVTVCGALVDPKT